jgi:hypothetical protein
MPSSSLPSRRLALLALSSLTLAAACALPPLGSAASGSSGSSGSSGGSSTSSTAAASSSGAGGADAAALPALRVLFIGNSYTYVNDLPGTVQKLVTDSGVAVMTVDSVAVPAATLGDHVVSTGAMARIDQGGWTHVVIQGQSQEPLFQPATFEMNAAILAAEAKKVGAQPVFYETWARMAGDSYYQDPTSGGTPAAMQAGLRAEYQKVALVNGGVVAPAGDAWEKTLAEQPAINVFQSDGSHPDVDGTYLVACVFHATLTGHSPVGIAPPGNGVGDADAAALQSVAEETVAASP